MLLIRIMVLFEGLEAASNAYMWLTVDDLHESPGRADQMKAVGASLDGRNRNQDIVLLYKISDLFVTLIVRPLQQFLIFLDQLDVFVVEDTSDLVVLFGVAILLTCVAFEAVEATEATFEVFVGSNGPLLLEVGNLLLGE